MVKATFEVTTGPHIALEDGTGLIILETGDELLMEISPTEQNVKATFSGTLTTKATFLTGITTRGVFSGV